jgi:hypothetical protein
VVTWVLLWAGPMICCGMVPPYAST